MSKTTLTRTIGTLLGLSGQFPMLMKSCGRQGLLYHAVDMVWDMMERSVMGHGGEVYHGKSEYPSCKVRGRLTKDREFEKNKLQPPNRENGEGTPRRASQAICKRNNLRLQKIDGYGLFDAVVVGLGRSRTSTRILLWSRLRELTPRKK
ncbi:hypothetical protein V6N12_062167 [Hibiscus sabdariffa]|uniref:Uncharacterized protein n=1 Tax=Hibiscus sabdariffa TaxID=183260 RepID=A0ABR2F821_9ROSI